MANHLALNVFSKHNLYKELNQIVAEKRNAFTLDDETIGRILATECCPTLTTFWQNLLKYTIFDVSFEETIPLQTTLQTTLQTPLQTTMIIMRYKKEDIDISIRASTKDCITTQIFYQGTRLNNLYNIDKIICIEIATILRELSNLIIQIVPTPITDTNLPECTVLAFA